MEELEEANDEEEMNEEEGTIVIEMINHPSF